MVSSPTSLLKVKIGGNLNNQKEIIMKTNIEVVIKKYENQECFTSDFFIEPKARKAYSGEKEPVERLIQHLEINHPGQVDFIERLKKHLLPEPELTQTSEPTFVTEHMVAQVSQPEAKQESLQVPKPILVLRT